MQGVISTFGNTFLFSGIEVRPLPEPIIDFQIISTRIANRVSQIIIQPGLVDIVTFL